VSLVDLPKSWIICLSIKLTAETAARARCTCKLLQKVCSAVQPGVQPVASMQGYVVNADCSRASATAHRVHGAFSVIMDHLCLRVKRISILGSTLHTYACLYEEGLLIRQQCFILCTPGD